MMEDVASHADKAESILPAKRGVDGDVIQNMRRGSDCRRPR
jgi:hypothetical protein